MPQSLSRLIVHIIFSTKGRQPFLADQSLRTEMHAVLGALCSKLDSPVIRVGEWRTMFILPVTWGAPGPFRT